MIIDGKFLEQYLSIVGIRQGSIFGPAFFLLPINDLCDVNCNIAIYIDDTTLSST